MADAASGELPLNTVATWLKEMGLQRYQAAFEEAEIDFEILRDLEEEDIRELGLPIGPRRKIWTAIKQLKSGNSQVQPAREPAAPPEEVRAETAPPSEAERRHMTVMFVDLVGSTEMTSRFDPEDMRHLITNYQGIVARVVKQLDGYVAKYMGDGVLCYFGWPKANEDDAERAVRAGLAMIEEVAQQTDPDGVPLSTRVGIATGIVVVGDLIGSGAAQEAAVVGETPNLAARLLSVAAPNELVMPKETQRLLGNSFRVSSRGLHELKGIARPVEVIAVIGGRERESRFAAKQQGDLTPIVGREQELRLINECWNKAVAGNGQLVLVSGEAGIGKSRIVKAVSDHVGSEKHIRITCQCSPYHTDSAFYPVIQHLIRAAQIEDADSISTKLEKLEQLVGSNPETVVLIAGLIGLKADPHYEPLDLSPSQFRSRTMQALVTILLRAAQSEPLLLNFEDLHWVDPTTLEFLDLFLDAIADNRIMVLATARPAFEHGFAGHPVVTRFVLNRLGGDQVLSVVQKLTKGKSLPEEVVSLIVRRTDGVPLFVEELTKTILESGVMTEGDNGFTLAGPLNQSAIPNSLHDSLMARLDRLSPVKEVAQTAACIGREFSHHLLSRISPLSESALEGALSGLIKAELVYRRGLPPEADYIFKHALIRDAAYESLLKERRRETHNSILSVLREEADSVPELMAFHAQKAGLREQAIELWSGSATLAQARPAYAEAISSIRTALDLIGPLTSENKWARTELSLFVQLAQLYIAKEGYASHQASEAFDEALKRVDVADDAELRVAIYYGTWIAPYICNNLHRGLQLSAQLVEDMANEDAPIPKLISRRMHAATLIAMGRPSEALADLEISFRLYESAGLGDFSSKFAQDPGVQIWCYQLLAQWLVGQEKTAVETAKMALGRARELAHANTICYAGLHAITLAIWMQDARRIRDINDEVRTIADEHDMSLWKTFCGIHDAVADCMDDLDGSAERLDACLEEYKLGGGGLWTTFYLLQKALSQFRMGDVIGALETIESALKEAVESGESWAKAELHRVRGEIRVANREYALAKADLKEAISIARSQGATALELRAQESAERIFA